jgi:hypothetical protein
MKTSNSKTELRIYRPKVVYPAFAPYVGKLVTVRWSHPSFNPVGYSGGQTIHECRFFGYVAELDRQIPEDELHPLLEPQQGVHT